MKHITMNDNDFTSAVKFYTSDKCSVIAADFYQFAIESCLRYVEHGEVSHINNLADAAKRMKSVVIVRSMVNLVTAHTLSAAGKYTGKANTKLLNNKRKNVKSITSKLEGIVKSASDAKKAKAKDKPAYDTVAQGKTIKSAAAKLVAVGLNDDTIIAMVRMQLEAIRANEVVAVEVPAH